MFIKERKTSNRKRRLTKETTRRRHVKSRYGEQIKTKTRDTKTSV